MRTRTVLARDLARSKGRLATVGALIAFSVAVVVMLGSLAAGLYGGVIKPLVPRLPLGLIRVEPKTLSLGVLAFDSGSIGGGIDAAALARLSKIAGVDAVFPVVGAGFPLRAEGGARLLGQGIRTDLFATGVDPALVAADIAPGMRFLDPGPEGEVIPVLVARRLLELYNSTVAPAIGRPKLSAEAIIGFSAEIVLGSSYVRGTPDPAKVERKVGQIVGVSDQATLVGITVPRETIERWNARHAEGKGPIVAAYVRTKRPSDAGPVAAAIERAGMAVDDTLKIAGAVAATAGLIGGLFAFALLSLSGFGIGQTFFLLVAERRFELAILRAMGARRRDLFRLVMAEASLVGFVFSLLGVGLGVAIALGLDQILLRLLPEVPFKPATLVAFPPEMLGLTFALGTIASVVGAVVPALRAGRADPATALRA